MKKTTLLLTTICGIAIQLHAQNPVTTTPLTTRCNIQTYKGKDYIFDAYVSIIECTNLGEAANNSQAQTATPGFTFNVVYVDPTTCDVIIQLDPFKVQNNSSNGMNLAAIFNNKFFRVRKVDMDNSCSVDNSGPKWNVQFGTFTTPFKIRPTKSKFTNNLSLGSSVSITHSTWWKDWTWGFIGGFSLTSVTLDSYSTNDVVKKDSDRPAYTPNVSALLAYKNINFTLGTGIDYINKNTIEDESWIFNGKPWIGFGIGINLFSTGSADKATKKSSEQENK